MTIFIFVLGVFTIFLNSWNSEFFGLQLATVVGLVDDGSFALKDQVYPGFNLVEGDETFRYDKQVYPMKQPGQSILGAIIYAPLKLVGIEVSHHKDYAVHIITFLTSSLMGAGIATLLYLASYKLSKNHRASLMAAVVGSAGSILLPYAGVMHHDIYASFFLFCGVYLLLTSKKNTRKEMVAGILTSLSLFFSMLPVMMVIGLVIIVYSERKEISLRYFLLGVMIGLLPSLIFNYVLFGNPLLFPNLAGKVADTIPLYSIPNFVSHLNFFLLSKYSVTVFSPVIFLGLWGVRYIKDNPLLKKIIIYLPLILLAHISTQETYGGFQYGPRYLLPALPILALGIPYYLSVHKSGWMNRIFYLALSYSIIVAIIGAMTTVMYPVPGEFGPFEQGAKIVAGEMPEYRMLLVGLLLITSSLALHRRLFPRT